MTVLSNCYPGHVEGTVRRRSKDQSEQFVATDVPMPSAIRNYNRFMGGVDLSDHLIGYHCIV